MVLGALTIATGLREVDDPLADAEAAPPIEYEVLAEAGNDDFRANERLANSAPQQQVVASWAIRDMNDVAVVQADATNELLADIESSLIDINTRRQTTKHAQADDDRDVRLLLLATLAPCWIGMWMVVPTTLVARHPSTQGGTSATVVMRLRSRLPAVRASQRRRAHRRGRGVRRTRCH
jgi:hypothetical protein